MLAAKVYLAGPEVFLPNSAEVGNRKKALCQSYGLTALAPFENEAGEKLKRREYHRIFEANIAMMREVDFGILNLTPFRGPSADVGTVFELGYLTGLGKPVFGYTNVASQLRDRVMGAKLRSNGDWTDLNGLSVEDFGNADNLMIDGSLACLGREIVRIDAGGDLSALAGFRACIEMALEELRSSPQQASSLTNSRFS